MSQVQLLGAFSKLAAALLMILMMGSAQAVQATDYPKVISKAFVGVASGDVEAAWATLAPYAETFEGDVEYELLAAEAALETQRFAEAQIITRRLAKLVGADDAAGLKARIDNLYGKLQAARDKLGRSKAIRQIDLTQIDSSVGLNINFNRKRIGLPYVGDVKPWKKIADQPSTKRDAGTSITAAPSSSNDALAVSIIASEGYDQALVQARQLMSEGQSEAAYQLLLPYELTGAGEIDYDYLLGTAATDSGHAGQAIFILMRVINQQPSHAGARIELGRAYYANQDYEDAKLQFERVLAQNPPPLAKQVSEQYLAVISERLASRLSLLVPYVDVRVGFDTNANSATDNSRPFQGLAGVSSSIQNFTLNPNSTEQDSPFAAIDTGLSYSRQFSPRWFVKTGGKITARSNTDAHFVDTRNFWAYGSVEKRVGRNFASVGLDLSRAYLGGNFNADIVGLNLVGGHELSEQWTATHQLRLAKSNYASSQVGRDSEDYTLSTSYTRGWAGPKQLAITVGGLGQRTDADAAKSSKDLLGLQFGLSMLPLRATLMAVSLAYLDAEYDAPTVGTAPRKDRTLVASLGFTKYSNFDPNLKWLLNIDVNQTDSTLGLFDSDGTKVSMGVRYDFY